MDRRTFNKLIGTGGVAGLGLGLNLEAHENSAAPAEKRQVEWPGGTYRRLLVDMHVPDWDSMLTEFNAADYVGAIARGGFQALMQDANSAVGLALWRTRVGQMHAAMKGRDFFGEVMEECSRHNLQRLAYYCLILDDWAYEKHPDWRMLPEEGYDPKLYSRTATVCPNSPYRDHALACLRELVGNYDFEGIFLDITMWPVVCYCPHCTARFWREYNEEPPRIVNWNDPAWRSFQKAREKWMLEFARSVTQAIKQTRPIAAYHQFGSAFGSWTLGVSLEQREASDFCSGDFYGGAAQFSLVCKTYYGLTPARPFEFMTSRTKSLQDFETTKPLETLQMESLFPTIHSSATLLIDAIKPMGTLNDRAYDYMGEVNALHGAYEPFLGGEMLADVAIYYDKHSMYNPDDNGLHVSEAAPAFGYGGPRKNSFQIPPGKSLPHMEAVLGATRILREAHIPFGVVTNVTLDQLSRYRAVMLPSVLEMTAEQAEHFRRFVREGGVLYVSGPSSLDQFDRIGSRLEDVLGVRYLRSIGSVTTYLSPKDAGLQKVIWPQENITFDGRMVQGEALARAEVLATVTLPFVEPERGYAIGARFAQLWSNPPAAAPGRNPGLVINSFGKGKSIWVSAPIETGTDAVYARIVSHLIRRFLPGPYHFQADTHPSVEATLFHQAEKQRLLVSLLNTQAQTPMIPVGATVRVHLPAERRPKRVLHLPDPQGIVFEKVGPYVQFRLAPFKLLAMALVEYE
ncbi:MAG TPA: alpha-amylase family protein [Terriglobia bacterium]|nr:alpha-amylase family protein [Terriglobia bacterium]